MFRGIDQAYNAIHPLLAKHNIFTVPRVLEVISRQERQTRSGGILSFTLLSVEYDFVSGADGSRVTVGPIIGEGMDSGDKGCNKALAVAHKYALFQTFVIPTEKTDDPDADTHDDIQPIPPANQYPNNYPEPAPPQTGQYAGPVPEPPPPPQQLPPQASPADDELYIADAQGAKELTDFLIDLATNMHSDSLKSLAGFWKKNIKVIDKLDTEYNAEYQRLKQTFTQLKNSLTEKMQ